MKTLANKILELFENNKNVAYEFGDLLKHTNAKSGTLSWTLDKLYKREK